MTARPRRGPRLPRDAVPRLAAWMVAFRGRRRRSRPTSAQSVSVRRCTALMADALRDAGLLRRLRRGRGALRAERRHGVVCRRGAAPPVHSGTGSWDEPQALEHPRDRVADDVVDGLRASGRTPAPAGRRSRPSRRTPASGGGGPTCSGVSRTRARSGRPSLSVTSPARAIRVSAWQLASAARVLIEQGAMTIAAGAERAAGDRRPDVAVVVDDVGQRLDLPQRVGRSPRRASACRRRSPRGAPRSRGPSAAARAAGRRRSSPTPPRSRPPRASWTHRKATRGPAWHAGRDALGRSLRGCPRMSG